MQCYHTILDALQAALFALQAKHTALKEQEDAGLVAFFPVMSSDNNTWDAVTAISRIQPSIRPTSKAKIEEAKVIAEFPAI